MPLPGDRHQRMEARRGSELLECIHLIWPQLASNDRGSLRACCHATRQRADWMVDAMRCLAGSAILVPESVHLRIGELARAWRGVLVRGARPRQLRLELPPTQELEDLLHGFGLSLLTQLRDVTPPALEDVRLSSLSLSPQVVRGIAAAAPQLRVLQLSGYCPYRYPHDPQSLEGVAGVLRHAAPHLEELVLHDCGSGWDAWWLPAALKPCTRLASLSLNGGLMSADEHLAALGQLPRLRSLSLAGVGWQKLAALPVLSHLTQLCLDAYGGAPLCAVAQLRGLVRLELKQCTLLLPGGLQQLAGLTALKHLHVRALHLPRPAPREAGSGAAGDATAPITMPLPPRLESLQLSGEFMHPRALAALRFPSGRCGLRMGRLRIQLDRDVDVEADSGKVGPAVVEALLGACRQLAGRTRSASLWLSWMQPPASWPDRYGTLFAALQPAALRRLVLRYVSLQASDVAALAQHLPELQVLDLLCDAPALTWPLLRRLGRLRELRLHPGIGALAPIWEEYGSQQALRAALLALCLEAPSLRRLVVAPASAMYDSPEVAALAARARVQCGAAVEWLAGALPRLRPDPPGVSLLEGLDVWADDIAFGQQQED